MILNVWCVWVNTKYNFKYVQKLYDKINEFNIDNITINFFCVVDSPYKKILYKNINYIEVTDERLTGVWYKYYTLCNRDKLCNNYYNNILFDLDVVILQDLFELLWWAVSYRSEKLAICLAYDRLDIFNARFGFSTNLYLQKQYNQFKNVTFYNSSICIWTCKFSLVFNSDLMTLYNEGLDYLLYNEDLSVNIIPIYMYYTPALQNWQQKNLFSVALINQSKYKTHEITYALPWIKQYWID